MKIFKYSIIAIAILICAYFAFINYVSWKMQTDMNKTLALLEKNSFSCPDGSKTKIERWGKLGYSRYCLSNGKKHGQWEAWESQYKNIDGSYSEGQKDGKWTWYNKNGSIYRIINYKDGLELSDKIFSKENKTEQKH